MFSDGLTVNQKRFEKQLWTGRTGTLEQCGSLYLWWRGGLVRWRRNPTTPQRWHPTPPGHPIGFSMQCLIL